VKFRGIRGVFYSHEIHKAADVELGTNPTCAGSGDIRQTSDKQSRQTENQLLTGKYERLGEIECYELRDN
jgi:hypothetical protein